MSTTASTTPDTPFSGTASGPDSSDSESTSGKATQAASQAADEGKKVASTAADETRSVASEATTKARDLLDEALGQVSDHSKSQIGNLTEVLRSLGDDLQDMVEHHEGSGVASDVVRRVADRAHTVSDRLDGREPNDLLDDLRRFARQRPALFLGGALVAGVLAGRFARGMKGDSSGPSTSGAVGQTPSATLPPAPAPAPPVAGGLAADSPLTTSAVVDPAVGEPFEDTAATWPTGDRQAP